MSTQNDYNAKIYVEQGSTKMCYESGAEIEEQAGAYVRVPVELNSSLDLSMNRNGVSEIRSTIANTFTVGRAKAGMRKTIVNYSTLTQTVRGATTLAVKFGWSTRVYYSLSLTGTTFFKHRGQGVELIAKSSAVWMVVNRSTARCAFSTACT